LSRQPADERIQPETFAYQLVEHVADHVGEDGSDAYLATTVREVLELAPAAKDAIVADLLTELKEEIAGREDSRYSRATIALVEAIENEWRNRG
jgi:hypothetical protein